jgi:hypothetical protein
MRKVMKPTNSALAAVRPKPTNRVNQGDMPVFSVSQAVV